LDEETNEEGGEGEEDDFLNDFEVLEFDFEQPSK